MKKLLPVLILIFSFQLKSQTVTSTCAGTDYVVKRYMKDASRLALRHSYHTNSTYTDSVTIDPVLRNTYLKALIAVYNCSLSIRDTIVDSLDIHTNPGLEMNTLILDANPANAWMQNLQNSVIPTGYAPIDHLIGKYHLGLQAYYQSTQYDEAIFHTDTNYNVATLATLFAADATVLGSSPAIAYNDVTNITDSVNPAFTLLSYSYGWGTCQNGCDFRSYWAIKVYTSDCHVEYMGHAGDNLVSPSTGIKENTTVFKDVQLYPNPVSNQLTVKFTTPGQTAVDLEILNPLGQTVIYKTLVSTGSQQLDLGDLNSGVYFVRLKNAEGTRIVKLVKE